MKKALMMVLVATAVLAGCQEAQEAEQPTTTIVEMTAAETTTERMTEAPAESTTVATTIQETTTVPTTTEAAVSQDSDKMVSLITEDQTVEGISDYIRENMAGATPEEAEEMIFWLQVYQTDIIQTMNTRIYKESYMEALNQTMGGILEPDKIADIEDEEIRADFQTVRDGFMTIVRYGETPVFEMDWSALTDYESVYSDAMKTAVTLQAKRRDYDYTGDVATVAEDIIKVETLILESDDDYVRHLLATLHAGLVAELLVGPEGSYIDTFVNKEPESELYQSLMDFASTHSNTDFGAFLLSLDHQEWADYSGPNEALMAYIGFGYGSGFHWEHSSVNNESMEGRISTLVADSESDVVLKVNDALNDVVEALSLTAEDYYSLNMDPYYNSSRLMTVLVGFRSAGEAVASVERYMNFDMKTGEQITLSDYLGVTEDELPTVLEALTGRTFIVAPQMIFFGDGIYLIPGEADGSTFYETVNLKDLIPYVEKSGLLR